ncbi:HNH endonuclease [Mycobacterium phage Indlovu]|nr:HNH endonuclease [Mycobacterium phage Indlovu]
MTTAKDEDTERWSPDDLLIPAVLAGSRTTMADLSGADRAWVVVGLYYDEGLTAEAIADRLDCSVRLVRAIAADATGQVMRAYRELVENGDMTHRMVQSEVARLARELTEAQQAAVRYAAQRDRLLAQVMAGGPTFPKCGHAKTKYNTYRHPSTGKESCRTCHAEAQAAYRARVKASRAGYTMVSEVVDHGSSEGSARPDQLAARRSARSGSRQPEDRALPPGRHSRAQLA